MKPFYITYWVSVPKHFILHEDGTLAAERIDEVKEAGMDLFVADYDVKTNLSVMDYCEKIGLKVTVRDDRIESCVKDPSLIETNIPAAVRDYGDHPALFDYYVFDEPNVEAYPALAAVSRKLEELDPSHPPYINLFPNYANEQQLGTASYDDYVERYINTVKPYNVSWDHYHFMNSESKKDETVTFKSERDRLIFENAYLTTDRAGFFDNLECVRRHSLAAGLPYMNIVLLIEHGPYRNLTEEEIRFEAMQSLCYGCNGLSWFGYWSIKYTEFWHPANPMVDNGKRLKHYYDVKKANADFHALGDEIGDRKSVAVFHGNDTSEGTVCFPADGFGDIRSFSGNAVLGIFEDNCFVIASKDYVNQTVVELKTECALERFDKKELVWKPAECGGITLAAGDAELFRAIVK